MWPSCSKSIWKTEVSCLNLLNDKQVYDSDDSMAHFAKFGNIFGNLSSYRIYLMSEARDYGLPLMRPMVLHYFYDDILWQSDSNRGSFGSYLDRKQEQYLFGQDFIVAPTLSQGQKSNCSSHWHNMDYIKSSLNLPYGDSESRLLTVIVRTVQSVIICCGRRWDAPRGNLSLYFWP